MKFLKSKWFQGFGLAFLVFVLLAGWLVVRVIHRVPKELMADIRAGRLARNIKDPNERFEKYLEGRYGDMSDPANRQKAFLDFFNPEHIRALQFLVKYSPPEHRQANIQASADWIGNYRTNLTEQQRSALKAILLSDSGKAMLKQATAQYNVQDVYYRGATVPVISQLLTTIHEVQKAP